MLIDTLKSASSNAIRRFACVAQTFNNRLMPMLLHVLLCMLLPLPFQALQVLIQHSDVGSDAKAVCSLLQTCRSWRGALQQCSAGKLCASMGSAHAGHWDSIQQLSLFCSWLQQQAGLVQEICVAHPYSDSIPEQDAYCDAAEQLLMLSLQEAAGRRATPPSSSSSAAAAGSPAAAAAPAALQLRSFSTNFMRSPALLRALPAAALTQLTLERTGAWRTGLDLNSSSVAQALAQLSSLRSLTLQGEVGNACLAEVGKLAHLTYLQINKAIDQHALGCNLQLLPLGLQEARVFVGSSNLDGPEAAAAAVALGHLMALRTLELVTMYEIAAGSSLPTSLTALTVRACVLSGSANSVGHLGIQNLQQLQQLRAGASCLQQPELLAALSNLAQLDHVMLDYRNMQAAARAPPAWRHLSALQALYLEEDKDSATLGPAESLSLVQGLAAATSVTRLEIEGPIVHDSVQLCAHLTGLTQLQQLNLCGGEHPTSRAEALHLTVLTNLTKLVVCDAPGIEDTSLSALAVRLTKLQDLQLWRCSVWSSAALPVVASLTGLTSLVLMTETLARDETFPMGRDDLLLLTPLTQLQRLMGDVFFTDEAMHELWDARLQRWRQQQQ
jgi:hypothetical protein